MKIPPLFFIRGNMDEFDKMKKDMEESPISSESKIEKTTKEKARSVLAETSVPPQPQSIGVFGLIGLIIKLAPIIIPIINGIFRALDNRSKEINVDEAKLEELVRELTEKEIKRVVAKHRADITPYVPTEEEKERQKRIDELMEELEKAHESSRKRQQGESTE